MSNILDRLQKERDKSISANEQAANLRLAQINTEDQSIRRRREFTINDQYDTMVQFNDHMGQLEAFLMVPEVRTYIHDNPDFGFKEMEGQDKLSILNNILYNLHRSTQMAISKAPASHRARMNAKYHLFTETGVYDPTDVNKEINRLYMKTLEETSSGGSNE